MTDQSDIVERLLSNAVSWLRDDAFCGLACLGSRLLQLADRLLGKDKLQNG